MIQHDTSRRVSAAHREGCAPESLRFETLDSWRGICAILVAMMHFPASGLVGESPLVRGAFLFVDYFFVLSGFVITHGYGRKLGDGADYLRFIVLRLGRIYPLHLAVLLLFVGFEAARLFVPVLRGQGALPFGEGNTISELWSSLALLNGVGIDDRLAWNGPSWSISAEVWSYVLFGAAVLLLQGKTWLALAAAVPAAALVLVHFSPKFMDATWDFGFARCVYGFAVGALLYGLCMDWLTRRQPAGLRSVAAWTAAELVAVAAVVTFVTFAARNAAGIAAPLVFAAVLAVFVHERGLVSRLLRMRLFLWLGSLSYGIYMVHIFVQSRLVNVGTVVGKLTGFELVGPFAMQGESFYGFGLRSGLFGTMMFMIMIVLVVATAWFGNQLVEKPFQRWSRRQAANVAAAGPAGRVVGQASPAISVSA
jgi:peptidoglycan/LPS O-acetylase OafA/YrhL